MNKFKYPLSIKIETQQQADEMSASLIELGYQRPGFSWNGGRSPWLLTHMGGKTRWPGFNQTSSYYPSTVIEKYNKDLILALAAMRDDELFHENEWVVFTGKDERGITNIWNKELIGKLMKVKSIDSSGVNVDKSAIPGSTAPSNHKENFRKATKEEIMDHFNEFVLPEIWYVRVTEENKDVLSKWRDTELSVGSITGMFKFSEGSKPSKEWNRTVNKEWKNEITYEQFKKYVLKEEPKQEQFPDKWVIRQGASQEVCGWFRKIKYCDAFLKGGYTYVIYPENNGDHYSNKVPKGYTEITVEQFKTHILKQSTMEKKIVSYKMKPEFHKYAKQAAEIEGYVQIGTSVSDYPIDVEKKSSAIQKLKDAGVLDIWFEPVYSTYLEYNVGDYLYCVKDFKMSSGYTAYTKGIVYKSERNGCITDDQGSVNHTMSPGRIEENFRIATDTEAKLFYKGNIKILGRLMEKEDGKAKFGCRRFSKTTIEELISLAKEIGKDFQFKVGDTQITLGLLNKIYNQL